MFEEGFVYYFLLKLQLCYNRFALYAKANETECICNHNGGPINQGPFISSLHFSHLQMAFMSVGKKIVD